MSEVFKIVIIRILAHLLLEVCSLLSFPIFCPNPFLTFEVSYLCLSVHQFTKFWNMALGIKIYPDDWVLDSGQVLLHIFLQFLWRWSLFAGRSVRKSCRQCELHSMGGFLKMKDRMSHVAALQFSDLVVVSHRSPRRKWQQNCWV